jgi:hypothetical protein
MVLEEENKAAELLKTNSRLNFRSYEHPRVLLNLIIYY